MRAELREELYRLIVVLQFQDIAAQQPATLERAAQRGAATRARSSVSTKRDLVSSPDRDSEGEAPNQAHEWTRSYDPAASMLDAEDEQAPRRRDLHPHRHPRPLTHHGIAIRPAIRSAPSRPIPTELRGTQRHGVGGGPLSAPGRG